MIKQKTFISNLLKKNKGAIIIGSLGTISYDLQELDNGQNCILPIKGAMGCSLGFALGYAMSVKHKVILLIGEGSLIMKMGSIATINRYRPKNLKVVILNNGKYASCGGQKNNANYILSNVLSHLPPRLYQMLKVS